MASNATHNEMSRSTWSGRGSLAELVRELERRKDTTFDFVTNTKNLSVVCEGGEARLVRSAGSDAASREFIGSDGLPLNDSALGQLGDRMSPGIPGKFLRELVGQRPAQASNLLTGLLHETNSNNLVRCLDGNVRAFLSDKYNPGLDNHTLAFAALRVARDHGAEVLECNLTDSYMRIKMVRRDLWESIDEVRAGQGGWYAGGLGNQEYLKRVAANTRGDMPGGPGTIHPVSTIGNSETGHGAMFTRIGILRAVCFNLATVETVISNVHLGARLDPGIFRPETIKQDVTAIMMKASDSIATAFHPARFAQVAARIRDAQNTPVEATRGVDFALGQGMFTKDERDTLLAHFLGGSDQTAYGLAQAVSRFAQDVDADRADTLESFAGSIINKPEAVLASK